MLLRNHYRCVSCGRVWSSLQASRCDDDCKGCGARGMSPFESTAVGDTNASRIALLNDAFRTTFSGGRVVMTSGVAGLPDMVKASALRKVAEFSEFTEDNDPYGERDFGAFELCNRRFFWKIDYYDERLEHGSDDPADPQKTTRVLTLMLASEY